MQYSWLPHHNALVLSVIGLIEIRDGSSQQIVRFGGQFRADCNGFCDMVRTKDCMWAAANNGYVQLHEKLRWKTEGSGWSTYATNEDLYPAYWDVFLVLLLRSSVYVFDLQLHNNLKELCIHRGSVQSICCIASFDDRETVATGGGMSWDLCVDS